MPKSRPPYSPEFRCQTVDLVLAGRNPGEFEPTGQSICAWVAKPARKGRQGDTDIALAAPERDEPVRLRRESKQLWLERDILSKAAAWFARDRNASVRIFRFMSTNQPRFQVAAMVRVLGVSKLASMRSCIARIRSRLG
jgi:transposase